MRATPSSFWAKVIKGPGCWTWNGAHLKDGYARVKYQRRETVAHRIAWELARGPIPAGLKLEHLCRNRACVNPDHLEPVTHRENQIRGDTVIRANHIKTHCLRGHPLSGENLLMRGTRRQCRICHRARTRKSMQRPAAKARHAELERIRRAQSKLKGNT